MFVLLVVVLYVATVSARLDYIVGGSDAELGAYKYQISLRHDGSHTCGGTLISKDWVMTAAHCAYSTPSRYTVTVGMHDQSRTKGKPVDYQVSAMYKHEDYVDGLNFPNDIALAKLSTSVDMTNPYVEAANLAPSDDFTYAGSDCHISGWGLLQGGGSKAAETLQESSVDCLTNDECKEYWTFFIGSGHICIFDKGDNSVSACNGDSGGPMSCKRNGTTYVVGVASWVGAGCDISLPGAYTRVSKYRQWVTGISGI